MIETKLKEFFAITENVKKYNLAIDHLRDAGFEDILTLLGSAESVDYSDAHAMQIAAFQQAEAVGWQKCVNTLFKFLELNQSRMVSKEDLDYGARQSLQSLGYSEEQIEQAINDTNMG